MKIGFHTDAFNSSYKSFEDCLKWAEKNGVHYIECGLIDGVSWIHGLGYQPHVALYEDPELLRQKMAKHGVRFSDAQVVPYDPASIILDEAEIDGEARLVMIGADALARIVVVVLTWRGQSMRLISARRASGRERKIYEEGI